MESNFVPAYKLRDKNELKKIPNDKPGYYKWWANHDTLQIILDKLNMQFDDIKNYLDDRYIPIKTRLIGMSDLII